MEAPKEIYLTRGDKEEGWSEIESIDWSTDIFWDDDVAYIRKDIYDDLDKSYFRLYETGTGHNYGLQCKLDEAQARIKELEEALKNSLRCGWHSMEGSIDGTFDDLTEQEIRGFREDARKALEKETEG